MIKTVVGHARSKERRGIFLSATTPIEHCVPGLSSTPLVRSSAEATFELFEISSTHQQRRTGDLTLRCLCSGLRSVGLTPSATGLPQGDPDPDEDGSCNPADPDPFARL